MCIQLGAQIILVLSQFQDCWDFWKLIVLKQTYVARMFYANYNVARMFRARGQFKVYLFFSVNVWLHMELSFIQIDLNLIYMLACNKCK